MNVDHYSRACRQLNQSKYRSFVGKHAIERYLKPLGLSSTKSPPPDFGENITLFGREEETLYFEALHFVRYQLKKSLTKTSSRETKKWYALYLAIRNRIVSANIGLIRQMIRVTSVQAEYDTLVGFGHVALMTSVDYFNPWLNYRFSTYGCRAILQSFYRTFEKKKSVPIANVDPADAYIEASRPDKNRELLIDRIIRAREECCFSKCEKEVLKYRYEENQNLREIGDIKNITRGRVHQIEAKALEKLRSRLDSDRFLQ